VVHVVVHRVVAAFVIHERISHAYISFRQEAEERRNKERAAVIEARKRAEAKAREREVRTE
jgi:hypothetical protein